MRERGFFLDNSSIWKKVKIKVIVYKFGISKLSLSYENYAHKKDRYNEQSFILQQIHFYGVL